MKKSIIFLNFIVFVSYSCNSNVEPNMLNCEEKIIIDSELYESAPNDSFKIKNVKIVDDCLKLLIEYGGGCGEIKTQLIDAGVILESLPVQRKIRLAFKDDDYCKAIVTKEISFDLTPIQVSNHDKIYLDIANWSKKGILYIY